VIVDLPPINLVADPLVVSKFLDGILLVLRHGVSKRSEIRDAVRQLKFVGAHILGFVYNGNGKEQGGRSHGYYSSSYAYQRKSGVVSEDDKI
jgi:Mrp family chromosome partitioning ATPase